MHIPENYVSPSTCATLTAAMLPIWYISLNKIKIQLKERPEKIPTIGIAAALVFLIMMFNLPVPGGTTAHAVGATVVAILFGPYIACISTSLALLIQAIAFSDGGIISFGVNAFNMAFIMPFLGYAIYKFLAQKNHDRLGAAIGSYCGIVVASLAVAVELGIQPLLFRSSNGAPKYFPYGLNITIPAMLSVHIIVIGFVELLLTVAVYSYVKRISQNDIYLYSESVTSVKTANHLQKFWIIILSFMALLTPLGLLAKGDAWGEWSETTLKGMLKAQGISKLVPEGMANGFRFKAPFPDYTVKNMGSFSGYILIAATIVAVVLILFKVKRNEITK